MSKHWDLQLQNYYGAIRHLWEYPVVQSAFFPDTCNTPHMYGDGTKGSNFLWYEDTYWVSLLDFKYQNSHFSLSWVSLKPHVKQRGWSCSHTSFVALISDTISMMKNWWDQTEVDISVCFFLTRDPCVLCSSIYNLGSNCCGHEGIDLHIFLSC